MVFGGENAESYYDEGLTASMRGELDKAVKCFEQAVKLDGRFLAAYHHLGKCYMQIGQNERAVALLKQVVARKPNQVPPRLDLAYASLSAGDTRQAREEFQHIVTADPTNPRGLLGLAHVAFEEADWSSAMVQAQAALERGGANFSALFLLGRAAKLAGNPDLAKTSLERAEILMEKSVELNPTKPEGYYWRGEVCFAQVRYSTALEYYRAADDRADPDKYYSAFGEHFRRVDILAKQGLCYQHLDRLDRAREVGKTILAIDPDHKLGRALVNL